MRAIILSAGQGRRLLPLTRQIPKCLLSIQEDLTMLDVQLRALASCGIRDATVMVGFAAEAVEQHLAHRCPPDIEVRTRYNPFFATTDNLVTCWLAFSQIDDDSLLINGDTVFEPEVLRRVLRGARAPVTLAIDHKGAYDEDDMKVTLDDAGRLRAVSKTLKPETVDGEAIGMIAFRRRGARAFAAGLDAAVRSAETHRKFYLAVVDDLASARVPIETVSVRGLWWAEIDTAEDLAAVRSTLSRNGEYLEHRTALTAAGIAELP